MPVNIGPRRVELDGIARITEADAARLSKHMVQEGDIVYSRRGDVTRKAIIGANDEQMICGTGCLLVRPGNSVNAEYLNYHLSSPESREWIVRHAIGATMPNLNTTILSSLPLRVPNRKIQDAIVHVLVALDDKIELNRQTNQTLEAMAQALFNSWFVDFDPVIDNALAAGNEIPEPLKARAAARQALGDARKPLPEEIRREFPDGFEFVDEMGWVPRGWQYVSLSELVEIKHGFAFKGEYFTKEIGNDVLVTPGNFKPGGGFQLNKCKYYDGPVPKDYVLKQGDVVVTMTDLSKQSDTLGYPAIIPSCAEYRFLHNQRVGLVSEIEERGISIYIYHVLKSDRCRHTVLGSATGTTVVHTSPKKILAHRTVYAGGGIEAYFENLMQPNFNRMQDLSVGSSILETLGDTLLPKLLSGQLTIPDAEKLVSNAL